MIKVLTVLLVLASMAHAEDAKFYIKGKEGTKADAIRALVIDPKTEAVKCVRVELTDKATLRNK